MKSTESNQKRIDLVVVGQGYVGLPLAQEAVKAGLSVAGLDRNKKVVDGLNSGSSHVDDVSNEDVVRMLERGYHASSDPEVIGQASTIVICVPTPLTDEGTPDITYVEDAIDAVAQYVRPGSLVSLESTTYPGTTDEVLRPALERSGFSVGKDLFLTFSPERINPGDPTYGFRNTPKILGGVTSSCRDIGVKFYSRIVDKVVSVSGTREAEMAKLLENTYRHVNIALVNELAKACRILGVDLMEVIEAAKTKPFGFEAFYPGPGVGGHCIPIDPNYLAYTVRSKMGSPFRFVELAQEINNSMPSYVRQRIADILNSDRKPLAGSKVLLLGVTYKANISDQRESPAIPLARLLEADGVNLTFHDPRVETWSYNEGHVKYKVSDLDGSMRNADIVVILQAHEQYSAIVADDGYPPILDTRGVVKSAKKVHRL